MNTIEQPTDWWLNLNGNQLGPFSPELIHEYLLQGEITLDDYCWKQGFSRWIQLRQTIEFMGMRDGVTEGPLSEKSDNISLKPQTKLDEQTNMTENEISNRQDLLGQTAPTRNQPPTIGASHSQKANYFKRHWNGRLPLPILNRTGIAGGSNS